MKSFLKKLIPVIFLLFLFITPTANAAWWSPFSWGSSLADWGLSFIFNDAEGLAQSETEAIDRALARVTATLANDALPGEDGKYGTDDDISLTEEDRARLLGIRKDLRERRNDVQGMVDENNQVYNNSIADARNASCGLDPSTWGNCVWWLIAWVADIIQAIWGFGLYFVALLFDASVYISISDVFQDLIKSDAITKVWIIARDLANIALVFIILWIAVQYAIDVSNKFNQRTIVNIIIIALLVNFSGFFTKIVIDASNVVAYEFYERISPGKTGLDNFGSKNLSVILASNLALHDDILQPAGSRAMGQTSASNLGTLFYIITQTLGTILLMSSFVFVLLVASILFLIRSAVLLAVYMASPLAMVSLVAPSKIFSGFFDKWQGYLLKQAFFAPLFLIPLYFTLLIVLDPNFTKILTWSQLGGNLFIRILTIGLTLGSVLVATSMSAVGAKTTIDLAGKANSYISYPGAYAMRKFGRGVATVTGARYVGNKIKGSWDTGRLSNSSLRKSWDTGVLRDLRKSKAAQSVKGFAKAPLVGAMAGAGKLPQAIGQKEVTAMVDMKWDEKRDKKADSIMEDYKKKITMEEKVKYLEGLGGLFNSRQLDAFYGKLSAEDRIKLEDTAKRTSPQFAAKLAKAKENLGGVAKVDTLVEEIKGLGAAEQIRRLDTLSPRDLERAYSKLNAEERAKITTQIKKEHEAARAASGPEEFKSLETRLGDIRSRTTPATSKQGKDLAKEEKKAEKDFASNQRIKEAKKVLDSASGLSQDEKVKRLRELTGKEIVKLIEENPEFISEAANHDLFPALRADHLEAIYKEDAVSRSDRDKIREKITNAHNSPPAGASPDETLKKAHDYLQTGGGKVF